MGYFGLLGLFCADGVRRSFASDHAATHFSCLRWTQGVEIGGFECAFGLSAYSRVWWSFVSGLAITTIFFVFFFGPGPREGGNQNAFPSLSLREVGKSRDSVKTIGKEGKRGRPGKPGKGRRERRNRSRKFRSRKFRGESRQ